jgi:hypothetical protein
MQFNDSGSQTSPIFAITGRGFPSVIQLDLGTNTFKVLKHNSNLADVLVVILRWC